MSVQRTVRVRLRPSREQRSALLETLRLSTICFNAVAAYGWEHGQRNGVELHKATYYPLRAKHPTLPSQLVVSARTRANEAIKSALTRRRQGQKASCPAASRIPVRYDARSYRMLDGSVSLASVSGRQIVMYAANPYAVRLLSQATDFDSADLILRDRRLWLHVVVTLPNVPFTATGAAVGIDLGLTRPAVTSEANFFGSRYWREIDRRSFRLRRKLQAKGTKSAKRHLRELRGKVNRFRRDCDHVLSKRIVQSVAPGTTVVVENLTDLRARVTQRGRASRRRLHSWSFAQLRRLLEYKAEAAACRVIGVDPRHTSQRCPDCGHIARANRDGARFHCRSCGMQGCADLIAARNIRDRHLVGWTSGPADGLPVKQPIVGALVEVRHGATHKPPTLVGGT